MESSEEMDVSFEKECETEEEHTEESRKYHADYPKLSFVHIGVSLQGVARGLSDLLNSPVEILLSPTNRRLYAFDVPCRHSKIVLQTREDLNSAMRPLAVIEVISELSDAFLTKPSLTREIQWDKVARHVVHFTNVKSIDIHFQTSRDVANAYQESCGNTIWLLSASKLPAISRVLNKDFLTEKSIFGFIRCLKIHDDSKPRGNMPPIWKDQNDVSVPLNARMVTVGGMLYFGSSKANEDIVATWKQEKIPVLSITYICKVAHFLRELRMLSIPPMPSQIAPENDYNVSNLYDAIINPSLFSRVDYKNDDSFNSKFAKLINAVGPSILMVDGGPGTGKTSKMVHAVVNHFTEREGKSKFLICAPSNSAVDLIYIQLTKRLESKLVVRTGKEDRFRSEVGLLMKSTFDSYADKLRQTEPSNNVDTLSKENIKEQMLIEADVVCVTLGSSQQENFTRNRCELNFDVLIVDESGQANFSALLLPLHLTSLRAILLLGDPRQLGPTFLSPITGSYKAADVVPYTRMYTYMTAEMPTAVVRLRKQYRMRPLVASMVNKITYAGEEMLLTPLDDENALWKATTHLPPLVLFSDQCWNERKATTSHSYHNLNEALFGVELLEAIMRISPLAKHPKITYAIICLYKGQVELFRRLLKEKHLDGIVRVASVDEMQGSEVHVAIISSVRASQEHSGIGFASDVRRLNVALSRGSCVYVLAQHSQFDTKEGWATLIHESAMIDCVCPFAATLLNNGTLLDTMLRQLRRGSKNITIQ